METGRKSRIGNVGLMALRHGNQAREGTLKSVYHSVMSIVNEKKRVVEGTPATTGLRWSALLLLGVCLSLGAEGCADDDYGASPGYGPGYYARYPGYAPYPGYGYPGYGYPGGSVTIAVGDRPYYTRGAGYYVGRSYYVWKPGHWAWRRGTRVWVHGHYVVRG